MARLGATALTRTPCGAASIAAQRVSAITPGLGRGVVRLAGLGPPAEHRGVVDDHARALRGHVAQRGPRAAERAGERDVEHPAHCSSVMSTRSAVPPRPALFTTTSMPPELGDGGVDERLHLRPRR